METGSGGDATFNVSVEYPRGSWAAVQTVVITSNTTGYVDVPVTIPAFAHYRITGDETVAGGGNVFFSNWSSILDLGAGDEYLLGAGGIGHATERRS